MLEINISRPNTDSELFCEIGYSSLSHQLSQKYTHTAMHLGIETILLVSVSETTALTGGEKKAHSECRCVDKSAVELRKEVWEISPHSIHKYLNYVHASGCKQGELMLIVGSRVSRYWYKLYWKSLISNVHPAFRPMATGIGSSHLPQLWIGKRIDGWIYNETLFTNVQFLSLIRDERVPWFDSSLSIIRQHAHPHS